MTAVYGNFIISVLFMVPATDPEINNNTYPAIQKQLSVALPVITPISLSTRTF